MVPEAGSGNRRPDDAGNSQTNHGRRMSVAQANAMLPYLRGALVRAQAHLTAMRGAYREMRAIESVGKDEQDRWILAADHRAAVRRLRSEHAACEGLIAEMSAHGCQVKDLDAGVCDFPGEVEGRPVLLCWRMDEPRVCHYHTADDGFAGRRAIPPGTP